MSAKDINQGPEYQEIIDFLDRQPVTPEIQYFLESQIYSQIYYFKELLGDDNKSELFKDYLKQQILNSEKAITDMIYEVRRKDDYKTVIITGNTFKLKNLNKPKDITITPEVVQTFLWNRERILVYKTELQQLSKTRTPTIVKFESLFIDAINEGFVSERKEGAESRISETIKCLKKYLDKNGQWRGMDEKEIKKLTVVSD